MDGNFERTRCVEKNVLIQFKCIQVRIIMYTGVCELRVDFLKN